MPWQADLECMDKPYVLEMVAKYVQCAGHYGANKTGYRISTHHHARVYWKEEEKMITDDWGFIIPSVVDDPKDFEEGKLVCSSCGCYVHRDKRESHREKCNVF